MIVLRFGPRRDFLIQQICGRSAAYTTARNITRVANNGRIITLSCLICTTTSNPPSARTTRIHAQRCAGFHSSHLFDEAANALRNPKTEDPYTAHPSKLQTDRSLFQSPELGLDFLSDEIPAHFAALQSPQITATSKSCSPWWQHTSIHENALQPPQRPQRYRRRTRPSVITSDATKNHRNSHVMQISVAFDRMYKRLEESLSSDASTRQVRRQYYALLRLIKRSPASADTRYTILCEALAKVCLFYRPKVGMDPKEMDHMEKIVGRSEEQLCTEGQNLPSLPYGELVHGYAQQVRPKEALETIERMQARDITLNPWLYTQLVTMFASLNDPDSARGVILDMVKRKLNVPIAAYNTLMNAYVNTEKFEDAVQVYEYLDSHAIHHRLKPDKHVFTTLIKCYTLMRMPLDKLLESFDEMLQQGFKPNGRAYVYLLRSALEAGAYETAESLFAKLDESSPKEVDQHIFTVMVQGFLRANKHEDARRYFRDMQSRGISPSEVTWTAISNADRSQLPLWAWGAPANNTSTPSPSTTTLLALQLSDAASPKDTYEMSTLAAFDVMHKRLQIALAAKNPFGEIRRKFYALLRILARIPEQTGRRFVEVMAALVTVCAYPPPREYFVIGTIIRRAERQLSAEGYCLPVGPYNALLQALASSNQPEQALYILARLQYLGIRRNASTYTTLILMFARLRDPDSARSILDAMLEEDIEVPLIACASLMNAYVEAGQWEAAIRIFNSMDSHPDGHSLKPNLHVYTTLMKCLAVMGKPIEDVLEALNAMKRRGITPSSNTYAVVLRAACEAGALDIAEDLFVQFDKSDPSSINVVVFTVMMQGMSRASKRDAAEQYYLEMRRRGIEPDQMTLSVMNHRSRRR